MNPTDYQVKTLEAEEKKWERKQLKFEEMFIKEKQDSNQLIEKMKSELEQKESVSAKDADLKELDRYRYLVRDYEMKVIHHQVELNNKDAELEKVRYDLARLWEDNQELEMHSNEQAKLICELQDLQKGTQEILKNQEKMHNWEASGQQKELKRHKKQIMELERKIPIEKEKINIGVQTEDNYFQKCSCRSADEMSLLQDYTTLTEPKQTKDEFSFFPQKNLPSEFAKSASAVLATSVDYGTESSSRGTALIHDLQRRVEILDEKLYDIQQLTLLKEEELNEIKSSHDRRLERFQTLQTNYKHLKDQLKTIEEEEELYRNPRQKTSNLVRAKPKDLQHENSDSVWNELAHFKLQNKNLIWEKLEIQEELDNLRVQHSHSMASLHEMRLTLDQEREDHEYFMQMKHKGENLKSQSELKSLRKERSANQAKTKKLEEELQIFHAQRNSLLSDRRCLKAEVARLKETIAQYRFDATNFKHQINRTKKQLHTQTDMVAQLKKKLECKEKTKKNTNIVKQYQKLLNKSIDNMQELFSEFKAEDWQEVSETTSNDAVGTSIPSPLFSSAQSPHLQQETRVPGVTSSTTASAAAPFLSPFQAQTDNDIASSSFSSRISSSGSHIKKVSVRSSKKHQVPRGRMSKFRTSLNKQETRRDFGEDSAAKKIKSSTISRGRRTIPCRSPVTAALKDASTSPLHSSTHKKQSDPAKVSKPVPSGRKFSKQKFQDLQRQIIILRSCRSLAFKSISDLKETVQQLQADLTLANQKLKSSRQQSQKLQERFDKVREENLAFSEKEKTEEQKEEAKNMTSELRQQISDLQQNKKEIETRLKASSSEVSRQVTVSKSLRADNENFLAQVKTLTNRINWLERDVNQKRHLIEEQKNKMKQMEDNAKSITETVENLSEALKQGTDSHEKRRVQVDSLKKQLSTSVKEKENYERKCNRLYHDLEKKCQQYEESITKQHQLKLAITEMEKTAQEHIYSLASESEVAISVTQQKLVEAHNKLEHFHRFIKTLSRELVLRTDQTKAMVKRAEMKKLRQEKPSPMSMQKAKTLAKDILNISDAEMDDIMKADSASAKLERDVEKERNKDQKWLALCEQTVNSRDNFVIPLIDLFIQKLEEKDQLFSKLNETFQ